MVCTCRHDQSLFIIPEFLGLLKINPMFLKIGCRFGLIVLKGHVE